MLAGITLVTLGVAILLLVVAIRLRNHYTALVIVASASVLIMCGVMMQVIGVYVR
jgi:hypothetical protein